MANISIVVVKLKDHTALRYTIPDDLPADQLVPALISSLQLPPPGSKKSNRYHLVRVQNGYILKDNETIRDTGASADEQFALATERELHEMQEHTPTIKGRILCVVVGLIFIAFTFPVGLTKLGKAQGWPLVHDIGMNTQSILNGLFGVSSRAQTTSFNSLLLWIELALAVYAVALLLLSIRHLRFDFIGLGLFSFAVGTFLLNLMTWAAFIALVVLQWLWQALVFIFSKLGIFFGFIFGKLGVFFVFLFGTLWWLFALLLVIGCIYLIVRHREGFFQAVLSIVVIGVIGGLFYGLIKLLQFLAPFLKPVFTFLAPIFAVIGQILAVIVRVLFIGFLVIAAAFVCGALVVDQLRGAWNAGNRQRGVIIGSFSIGTALTIFLVESNLDHIVRFPFYAPGFPEFVANNLTQNGPPLFDMLLTLLVIGLSIIGVVRNFPKLRREPSFRELQSNLSLAIFGIAIAIILLMITHSTESSDNN